MEQSTEGVTRRRLLVCLAALGAMPKILLEPVWHRGGVVVGKPYLVGEVGPELFIPMSPGRIVSQ